MTKKVQRIPRSRILGIRSGGTKDNSFPPIGNTEFRPDVRGKNRGPQRTDFTDKTQVGGMP